MTATQPSTDLDSIDDDLYAVDDEPDIAPARKPLTPAEVRRDNLLAVRRRLTPVRRGAVQLPRTTPGSRMGPLLRLASMGQQLAFDLEMLNLALQPMNTNGDFLTNAEWANMLSAGSRKRQAAAISRAWGVLEGEDLIARERQEGSGRVGPVVLQREDGLKAPWTHPGEDRDDIGYFSVPRPYWVRGFTDDLTLPGKAMLMILLSETNDPGVKSISHTHANFARFWGLSESTVKRGLADLRQAGILGEKWERRPTSRSATGETQVAHYWLRNPFSSASRERARQLDRDEIGAKTTTETGEGVNGGD
jgi:hypothetical protein